MTQSDTTNRKFLWIGLGSALFLAMVISPFASSNPDGLDRVSQDLQFEDAAVEDAPAGKLPTAQVFEEYALRGAPETLATPLAGLVGTLVTFGLAWGLGKLVVRRSDDSLSSSWGDSDR